MKPLLLLALCSVLSVGVYTTVHRHHDVAAGSLVLSPATAVHPVRTVEHIHATATPSGSRPHRDTCTDQHWRRTLTPDERFIDRHESRMDPTALEPTTGAYGLGQLLPSTYRNLGLVESPSPCAQIHAQRVYASERYGSWANARAFWQVNRWW